MSDGGICGVVLAAGASRRFGPRPKQLAPLRGRPLLQHVVDLAVSVPALARVVLVLGAHGEEIAAAVTPGRAVVVACEDWEEGIAASLRCGVAAAADAAWVLLMLGDEPALPREAVDAIVAAARAAGPEVQAVRATWSGRPGHPVALRRTLAGRVRELRGDEGARSLLLDAASIAVECGAFGDVVDVDRPEDLQRL